MNNLNTLFSFKEKSLKQKYGNVKEGFPISISISAKVFCPWFEICKGFKGSFYENHICINYEPKSLDFENTSLLCDNYKREVKNGSAKIRKRANSKRS